MINHFGEAKVGYFDYWAIAFGQEDIFGFEIAVGDPFFVYVLLVALAFTCTMVCQSRDSPIKLRKSVL